MHLNSRYLKIAIIMLTMAISVPFATFGENRGDSEEITTTGTLRKQGITSYMYGTHILVDDGGKTLYALRSDNLDLDKYVGRKVTVRGSLVKGYPVDFGPKYLDIKSID